ncbi:MAG: hypothetical protein ABJO54_07375 [Hyphomicrobiales bacterium]
MERHKLVAELIFLPFAPNVNNAVCPDGAAVCDHHYMEGLRGQKIEWSGVDGAWYNLIRDEEVRLHVNVRMTAPMPEEFPDRHFITGLSVLSEGHSLVIEVKNPYDIDTNGCPDETMPCLSDGGLRAVADGEEVGGFLHFSRDEHVVDGITVSASNLPAECRRFGRDKIWARMYDEMLQGTRQLATEENFEDWILRVDDMAAPNWCAQYIDQHDIADLQSIDAVFKIVTPSGMVRLNVGTNSQGEDELEWDGRVLPDLKFWQMNVGLDGLSSVRESLSGILGETAHPVVDEDGREVMEGYDAFRGTYEDYRVSGPLGTEFALVNRS